jgi:hypothetical protein
MNIFLQGVTSTLPLSATDNTTNETMITIEVADIHPLSAGSLNVVSSK